MKTISPVARRIAGRLLRAGSAGVIALEEPVRQEMVRALTTSFLTLGMREKLRQLWLLHGTLSLGHEVSDGKREDVTLVAWATPVE